MEPSMSWELWSIFAAILGGQAALAKWLVTIVRRDREASEQRDGELHSRINEVKDNYVRRDDLEKALQRIAEQNDRVLATVDRVHERIDNFLATRNQQPEGR